MEVIHTSEWVARNILALIHYKVEGNDKKFKETALILAGRLDLEGQYDKALFIRTQFKETYESVYESVEDKPRRSLSCDDIEEWKGTGYKSGAGERRF